MDEIGICLMIKWTKPKVRVYSDSVLCLGKMYDDRDAITRWEGQVEEFQMSASYKELLGIDGETIEFEWNILPGFSSLQRLQKIQNDVRARNIEPEKFTDRIIFMSMFNDIDWTRKRNDGICISNSEKVKAYEKRFSRGHWTFLGPGDEKSFKEDSTATQMMERFKDTGHPVFKSISALSRGILKKKFNRDTIHFNADASNTEFLFLNHSLCE